MNDKIKPCKKCQSTDIQLSDANYTSFNVGGGSCRRCGHEVIATVGCMPTVDELRDVWNNGQKLDDSEKLQQERHKTRRLRKQLRALGASPVI